MRLAARQLVIQRLCRNRGGDAESARKVRMLRRIKSGRRRHLECELARSIVLQIRQLEFDAIHRACRRHFRQS